MFKSISYTPMSGRLSAPLRIKSLLSMLLMNVRMLDSENRHNFLRLLLEKPSLTKRSLAREIDANIGRLTYGLKILFNRSYVKARCSNICKQRQAYMYRLTSKDNSVKAGALLLACKQQEFEQLAEETEILRLKAKGLSEARQ